VVLSRSWSSSSITLDNAIAFQPFTEVHIYCLGFVSVGIKYLKTKKILYVSAWAVETSLRNVMNPLRCQLNYAVTTPLIRSWMVTEDHG
jgi:hypothetical protein